MSVIRSRAALVVVGALVLAQWSLSVATVWRTSGADFGKVYFGWHQAEPYGRTPASLDVRPGQSDAWYRNLNPPHVFLIVWPVSHLPVRAAWMCWVLLQLASIAFLLRFTVRHGSGSGSPAAR